MGFIYLAVFAAVLMLVGIMVAILIPKKDGGALFGGILAIAAIVVLIGGALPMSYAPVAAGEYGLVRGLSNDIVGSVPEGVNFIKPWNKVNTVDIKIKRTEFVIEAGSEETQNVKLAVSLNWSVNPSGIDKLYSETGPDFFNILVPQRMQDFFKAEVVKYGAIEVTKQREAIRVAVAAALAEELAPYSLNVISLQIDNIRYDAAFEAAIEAKQKATQDALKAQEVVAQKEAEARQDVAEAEGRANADIARAEGTKRASILNAEGKQEVTILVATGNATAILLEAEAQSEANDLIAASLTGDLLTRMAIENLSNVSWGIMPGGSEYMFPAAMLQGLK